MRISDWSSDVCSSDLDAQRDISSVLFGLCRTSAGNPESSMSNRDRSFRHVVLFACLLAVVVFPLRATVPASSPEQAFDALWHLAQSPVGMESDAQHAEAISTMSAELFSAATFSEEATIGRAHVCT